MSTEPKTTGKTLSQSLSRRVVKKSNQGFQRARKSLKHNRAQQEFETAKKELQKLKKQQQAGKIDLCHEDESGFSLDPIVP